MLTNVLVLAGLLVLPAAALHRLAVDWRWTGAYTLAIHALAYAAYVLEKKRAQEGQRRLPEARLHLLELLGGWPGGLPGLAAVAAQMRQSQLSRHVLADCHRLSVGGIRFALEVAVCPRRAEPP